jgi:hypothetical protein
MDASAATLWLAPDSPTDPASLLAAGLRRYTTAFAPPPARNITHKVIASLAPKSSPLSPAAARALARRLLATDALAFCGNSRWEINNGWAPVAGRRDSPAPHARAARQLARLSASPSLTKPGSPLAPLAATLRFQAYLARREVFVRAAFARIHRIRHLAARAHPSPHPTANVTHLVTRLTADTLAFTADLRAARAAARAMWTASRPAATFAASQNARLLAADAGRLRTLRARLRAIARTPAAAFAPSPVCGRWTLRFTVHHFAPCHQKLVVEQLLPTPVLSVTPAAGSAPAWRELHARVLIEFRAAAARPQTPHLRFEFAVPIDDPDAPLRIAARCLGEFAVSHIELTDGVTTRQHRPLRARHVLGAPAPSAGWPKIDWATNAADLPLVWG